MSDVNVAPQLLKDIQNEFNKNFKSNKVITSLYDKVLEGKATYKEANEYAIEVGEILANAFGKVLSSDVLPNGKMYYNIAKAIIEPTFKNNYDLITNVTDQVQKILNKQANIGIKVITPKFNQDKVDGIINRVSNEDNFDDIEWILQEPTKLFSQSIVDDSIKANAEFHANSGMRPKIIRLLSGNCCDWCKEVAGSYSYPDVPKDVYRRHQRCRCTVDYYPGDGKVQNVHSKRWRSETEIEKRKLISIEYKNKNGKIYTGARILDPDDEYAIKWAKSYYEEIRHKSTDYKKVAQKMHITEDEALKIKRYLFIDKHFFNPIYNRWERFHPDAAIAQSWQRLAEGTEIYKHDKTLINHELLEMEIKKNNPSLSHQEAHELTNKTYNYSEEAREYYANLRKRNKKE